MAATPASDIRMKAMQFDQAVEGKDVDAVLSSLADDCEIQVLGLTLTGKEGAKKWLDWLYGHLEELTISPVSIAVTPTTFYEEYVMHAKSHDGATITSRQAEVLVYEDGKVKSLRLYFDRFDFAELVARGFLSKALLQEMTKASLKGLI